MSNYHYVQQIGGEEVWRAVQTSQIAHVLEKHSPMFTTVLAVSKLVEDLTYEDKLKLQYAGPLYFDWDSADEQLVIEKVNQFLDKLEEMRVDLTMCKLFCTGGKGFHLEIPQALFIEKVPKTGMVGLPSVYREVALALCVDTLDLKIYSAGRGRMWRTPNVKRENGRYKVPITAQEMREMTVEDAQRLSSAPRRIDPPMMPEFCTDLAILFDRCTQKVADLMKKRAKFKPDPNVREKASSHSIQYMMAGLGIKVGAGFQDIATQLAIAAVAAGLPEQKFVEECQGLIESHESDGRRYNTAQKRSDELRRMYHYMDGNLCYEFSVGAIKSLLDHSAPDLDGLPASKEDVKEVIEEAKASAGEEQEQDEYADVARGVTLSKYGIYLDTEFGKKRVCAVTFSKPIVLRSAESGQIVGYETDVMVNAKFAGRQTLELDVFAGLLQFNRFLAKYGHAFQGTDAQVRTVMMRFVEGSKKQGKEHFILKREGLDLVHIAHHENPLFHKPFLVWADASGVIVPEHIAEAGLDLTFAGFPDPRGVFKTDIGSAPGLVEWKEEEGNKAALLDCLTNLMTCQKPELLGKLIGWYTSCFWKPLFQSCYRKFPLLHVNGAAGAGKTEMNQTIASMFYYDSEPKMTSPGSTVFALQQYLTASSSIPLILDEYKPHVLSYEMHNKLKALFRDAYNQKDVVKGGGNRESEDYRSLHSTQLAAPMVFIAEAAEDEAAVMERVVLATVVRPPQQQALKWLARFQAFSRNKHFLGILGQYMAASIVYDTTQDSFREEFDALYAIAKDKYMLNERDLAGGVDAETLENKQNAKERSVYNHTVARFGFQQFRKLVNQVLADEKLDALMGALEDGIYNRMSDLHAATTPENIKVLETLSAMSHSVEPDRPDAIRKNHEYAILELSGGRNCIEIDVRSAYMRYRIYMKAASMAPLFGNFESFAYAIKDSPAFIKVGTAAEGGLGRPGALVFDADELVKLGVNTFK